MRQRYKIPLDNAVFTARETVAIACLFILALFASISAAVIISGLLVDAGL